MVDTPTNGNKNMYPQLKNGMQFRLNKIDKLKDYFIVELRERETISKTQQVEMFVLLHLLLLLVR